MKELMIKDKEIRAMDRYIDIKKRLLECANDNDEIESIIAIKKGWFYEENY